MMKTLLILAAVWAASVSADTMRCGQTLLAAGKPNGPTWYDVQSKCGKPDETKGYRWIYDNGQQRTVVVFNDIGQLVAIHRGF